MSMNVPRGFIMTWDDESKKYVPMFIKTREDDIVWKAGDKDDEYKDDEGNTYENLLAYILQLLENYVTQDDLSDIDWTIETPSSVNVVMSTPIKLYDNSTVDYISTIDTRWKITVDNDLNLTMSARIPLTSLFENGNNTTSGNMIRSSYIQLPYAIDISQGFSNFQITLDTGTSASSLDSHLVETSTYHFVLVGPSGDTIYDADESSVGYVDIQANNYVYNIDIESFMNELEKASNSESSGYANIVITGKGVKNITTLGSGTYYLNSSTITSTEGISGSNIYSSDDDSVTVTEDTYISFVAGVTGTLYFNYSNTVGKPVLTIYDENGDEYVYTDLVMVDSQMIGQTTSGETYNMIKGYTYKLSAPEGKTSILYYITLTEGASV